jgi:hypothetical protein
MHFIIRCTDKPGHLDVRMANRAAHLDYLKAHVDKLLIGGPTLTDDGQTMTGSMLVIDLPDRAAVDAFLAKEPYANAGLFEKVEVSVYKKVLP